MAKSKSFFGLRKGSTKTLTFQVVNGQQVTKDRVSYVKNPRTGAQMDGRCLMATASAAYSHMRAIVDHSFEGVTYGQKSMSKFIADNYELLKADAAAGNRDFGYNEYRERGLKAGKWKISEGTLPEATPDYDITVDDGNIQLAWAFSGLTASSTASDFAAAMGIGVGEMQTICFMFLAKDEVTWRFAFIRIKCKAVGDVALTTSNYEDYFTVESNLGTETAEATTGGFNFNYADANTDDGSDIVKGVINSKKSAAGWLRSTCYMVLTDGMAVEPSFANAVATFPSGKSYILNGGKV